jgi:hypothetical protein
MFMELIQGEFMVKMRALKVALFCHRRILKQILKRVNLIKRSF